MDKGRDQKYSWIYALMLIILLPFSGLGQGKDINDVTSKNLGKVIIFVVPFNPLKYEAVGDQFICNKSGINPGQLSEMMRNSFMLSLMENMNYYYDVIQPKDILKDPNSDISVFYQIFKYKTRYKKLKGYAKEYPPFSLWQKLGPAYMRWGSDCVNNSKQKPNPNHHKFEEAVIINGKDSIYSAIMNKRDCSYTLFITNFEMTTRFKTCLDLQNNVFQRDFYVHYTLLDFDGKYVSGGVVGDTYESNTNDVKKIIDHNISLLTDMIVANMRTILPSQ